MQELKPNGKYKGQKLTKLVSTKIPANTSNTIPAVPVTVPVKHNKANTTATITLIILSVDPMFVFINIFFVINEGIGIQGY